MVVAFTGGQGRPVLGYETLPLAMPIEPYLVANDDVRVGEYAEGNDERAHCVPHHVHLLEVLLFYGQEQEQE